MLGLGFAWVARTEIRLVSRSAARSAAFAALLIGQLLLAMPLGIYLYIFYPDWSWLYLVRASAVPSATVLIVMFGYPLAATGGYFGAVSLCRANREPVLLGLLGGLGLVLLVTLVVGWRRIVHVGTYEQYDRFFGLDPLHASSLGLFLLLALPALAGAWAWSLLRIRKAAAQK